MTCFYSASELNLSPSFSDLVKIEANFEER